MFKLLSLLKSLFPTLGSQRESEDAYLAESVDIYDLERRMHELDLRVQDRARGLALGLYVQ
jgi:hypothetical protein